MTSDDDDELLRSFGIAPASIEGVSSPTVTTKVIAGEVAGIKTVTVTGSSGPIGTYFPSGEV